VLTISPGRSRLTLHDPDNACHSYFCGARAGFDGESFDLKSRRPIGYLKRLVASPQYRQAISGKPQ